MEWVETTAKTVDAAREAALDQLGVAGDEAEFDVVEEPRPGLFGRVRGQARVRARVKPTPVRPKQERRRKGQDKPKSGRKPAKSADRGGSAATNGVADSPETGPGDDGSAAEQPAAAGTKRSGESGRGRNGRRSNNERNEEQSMSNQDDRPESTVTPQEVGDAAVAFMSGLAEAFGYDATTRLDVDGLELAVNVDGQELGLLVGPGGRTLNAVQDLARVAAQRRLGDHETRLRIDVAGYRERRNAALARFALEVAESVRTSGSARSLEPMSSADRKVIHDVLNDQKGVASRSEGEDPNRRIVVVPA